jgi:hypothetical protein
MLSFRYAVENRKPTEQQKDDFLNIYLLHYPTLYSFSHLPVPDVLADLPRNLRTMNFFCLSTSFCLTTPSNLTLSQDGILLHLTLGLRAGRPREQSLSPGSVKNFLFSTSSRRFRALLASDPMDTGGSFPGGKAAAA